MNHFIPSHTFMSWKHHYCFLSLKSLRLSVSECNLFFREQLNSLLKTYNFFYRNQKNLHILYGQVSSSKKCNTVWKWKSLSPTLCDYSPWNPPGQNTGVDNLSFSSASSWPRNRTGGLLHCRRILYQLSYQGSRLL